MTEAKPKRVAALSLNAGKAPSKTTTSQHHFSNSDQAKAWTFLTGLSYSDLCGESKKILERGG